MPVVVLGRKPCFRVCEKIKKKGAALFCPLALKFLLSLSLSLSHTYTHTFGNYLHNHQVQVNLVSLSTVYYQNSALHFLLFTHSSTVAHCASHSQSLTLTLTVFFILSPFLLPVHTLTHSHTQLSTTAEQQQ